MLRNMIYRLNNKEMRKRKRNINFTANYYKRMDMGITRSYPGSNHAGVYKLNTVGRSPQWNIVVTRREFQNNTAITEDSNNPDPSDKIQLES